MVPNSGSYTLAPLAPSLKLFGLTTPRACDRALALPSHAQTEKHRAVFDNSNYVLLLLLRLLLSSPPAV